MSQEQTQTALSVGVAHAPAAKNHHGLPPRYAAFQGALLPWMLVISEAYLLGYMEVQGWVPNLDSPAGWHWSRGVGVPIYALLGASCAGIGIACSSAMASYFAERKWGFALINMTGTLLFSCIELWVAIAERAQNLPPNKADLYVLSHLGLSDFPVTPTLLCVAMLATAGTFYYGFSQRPAVVNNLEDARVKEERKLLKAEFAAKRRKVQIAGLAATARAGVLAAQGKSDESAETLAPAREDAALDHETTPGEIESVEALTAGGEPGEPIRYLGNRWWSWQELQAYAAKQGLQISEKEARRTVATLCNAQTTADGKDGRPKLRGAPYVTVRQAAQGWVKKQLSKEASASTAPETEAAVAVAQS